MIFLLVKLGRTVIFIMMMLAMLFVGGCGGSGGASKDSVGTDKIGEAKFGMVAALSGGAANYGGWFKRGIDLAVEEINGAGGITVGGKKYLLKPLFEDSQGKSDQAASVTHRLINQDSVPTILTPSSAEGFAMMAFNQTKGSEFIVMCTSQSEKFTTQGNKLIVRISTNSKTSMPEFLDLVFKYYESRKLKYDKFAVMQVNTELGASWAEAFINTTKAKGKEIVGVESYDVNGTNFYNQLTNLISKNPDVIILTTVDQASLIVIKQAQELGYKGKFINSAAGNSNVLISLADKPERLENMIVECNLAALEITPEVISVRDKILTKYKEPPHSVLYSAYDGVKIMARAMEIAGTTTDARAIRASMPQAFKDAKTITGMKDLDETGEIVFPRYVAAIEGGKTVGFVK